MYVPPSGMGLSPLYVVYVIKQNPAHEKKIDFDQVDFMTFLCSTDNKLRLRISFVLRESEGTCEQCVPRIL